MAARAPTKAVKGHFIAIPERTLQVMLESLKPRREKHCLANCSKTLTGDR